METIRSSREISTLFNSGKRLFNPYITFIYSPTYTQGCQHNINSTAPDETTSFGAVASQGNSEGERTLPQGRVAFIAGKRLGNAVARNRAKRLMRSLCYELNGEIPGFDIIFLAKGRILGASYSKVKDACTKTLASLRRSVGIT